MKKKLADYLHLYVNASPGYFTANSEGQLNVFTLHQVQEMAEDPKKQVQLWLRPLKTVSKKEWSEIEQETSVIPDAWGYHGVRDEFLIGTDKYRFHWSIVNEALIELRRRGIDCDGLIDEGLAVDASEFENKHQFRI